jgi:hypothetical protein
LDCHSPGRNGNRRERLLAILLQLPDTLQEIVLKFGSAPEICLRQEFSVRRSGIDQPFLGGGKQHTKSSNGSQSTPFRFQPSPSLVD